MIIVDVHAHLGWDYTFDEDFTEAMQDEKIQLNEVRATIIQPGVCHNLEIVREQHNAIADLMRRRPGEFFGMANPSPHLPADDYREEVRRCIQELRFVGIKLHPLAHGAKPNSRAGRRAFETADEFGVPLMVHTGAGIPFASPTALIPMAQAFPKLPIVMAHAGLMISAGEALTAMGLCENLYADSTWTSGFLLRQVVRDHGAHRLMMGSDHHDNCATEITKLRTADLSDDELEWVLGRSAISLYRLPIT